MNMNVLVEYESTYPSSIPTQFIPFLDRPRLLPGESAAEYDVVQRTIIEDIQPQTGMEWLWTIDLIELSWDIIRYRTLRSKLLEDFREAAIEASLQRLDQPGIPDASLYLAKCHIRNNTEQWRDDPKAAAEIEARLRSKGIGEMSINTELFVQARELYIMFDSLTNSAQNRRMTLLREIAARRALTRRTVTGRISVRSTA
jgi:hypothetical protein